MVARHLCDRARDGQVLVSRLVCELLGGRGVFTFRDAVLARTSTAV